MPPRTRSGSCSSRPSRRSPVRAAHHRRGTGSSASPGTAAMDALKGRQLHPPAPPDASLPTPRRRERRGGATSGAATPCPGWEERVLDRLAQTARRKASRRRAVAASGAAILAAAAAGYFFFLRGPPPARASHAGGRRPARAHGPASRSGGPARRHHRADRQPRGRGLGGDPACTGTTPSSCSAAPIRSRPPERGRTCFVRTQLLVATVPVPAVGVYQPLLVTSRRPLPEPTGSLPADSARLLESGAAVVLGPRPSRAVLERPGAEPSPHAALRPQHAARAQLGRARGGQAPLIPW